jgi:hypothetical protein
MPVVKARLVVRLSVLAVMVYQTFSPPCSSIFAGHNNLHHAAKNQTI